MSEIPTELTDVDLRRLDDLVATAALLPELLRLLHAPPSVLSEGETHG